MRERMLSGTMTEIPSKQQILEWITDNPALSAKRDIAKAFGLKGAARIDLKRMLKELEDEGRLEKRRRVFRDPDSLPPVAVLQVLASDADGDQFARPLEWTGEGAMPRVLFCPRKSDAPVAEGDRILARLTPIANADHQYEARLIRKIGTNPLKLLGIFRNGPEGGRILPIDKGSDKEWQVAPDATFGAQDGELVEDIFLGQRG